jgi:hypothetical protein
MQRLIWVAHASRVYPPVRLGPLASRQNNLWTNSIAKPRQGAQKKSATVRHRRQDARRVRYPDDCSSTPSEFAFQPAI